MQLGKCQALKDPRGAPVALSRVEHRATHPHLTPLPLPSATARAKRHLACSQPALSYRVIITINTTLCFILELKYT